MPVDTKEEIPHWYLLLPKARMVNLAFAAARQFFTTLKQFLEQLLKLARHWPNLQVSKQSNALVTVAFVNINPPRLLLLRRALITMGRL